MLKKYDILKKMKEMEICSLGIKSKLDINDKYVNITNYFEKYVKAYSQINLFAPFRSPMVLCVFRCYHSLESFQKIILLDMQMMRMHFDIFVSCFHDRFLSISTPRNFATFSLLMTILFIFYKGSGSLKNLFFKAG